jgi:hypothetical protein
MSKGEENWIGAIKNKAQLRKIQLERKDESIRE